MRESRHTILGKPAMIQKILAESYNLKLSIHDIKQYLYEIRSGQRFFSINHQKALFIKLLREWEHRSGEKVITATGQSCRLKKGICVTTFGVLSVDWPGLYDTCTGILHEKGWNIYYAKGISLKKKNENLGLVLIGILTEGNEEEADLSSMQDEIISKIHQAAVGTKAKTYLLAEEYKKLEIYSLVIASIEKIYKGEHLEEIIGMNGEAVKYFAARSRDYIENRKVEDIADQIILNYSLIKTTGQGGSAIKLDIKNFETQKEGVFTGLTLAGPASMLHLEDCLKTIELTTPRFLLKHNREFTTQQGISIFRIEFVDSSGHPLSVLEQQRLRSAFSKMVLNKQRDRAQWIESIGGFEQYARAVIPLLVKEAQSTSSTQVYQSVVQATDLYIDFKVIVVVPKKEGIRRKLVIDTVNQLEQTTGFHILSVKPPKSFGDTEVFIIDLRASLTSIENAEIIFKTIKQKVFESLGEFRDFDEGMRTLDVAKLKAIRQRLSDIDKNVIRELYYSIEDFFRVSASGEEIATHIRITLDMIHEIDEKSDELLVSIRQAGIHSHSGEMIPTSTILCLSYPHGKHLLQNILDILEPFDVTLSRLERSGRDILTCRILKDGKALDEKEQQDLIGKINRIPPQKRKKNNSVNKII